MFTLWMEKNLWLAIYVFVKPDIKLAMPATETNCWWRSYCQPSEASPMKFTSLQQVSAPAHHACQTLELLCCETSEFTVPDVWPPNIPDLIPGDYHILGMVPLQDMAKLWHRQMSMWWSNWPMAKESHSLFMNKIFQQLLWHCLLPIAWLH